jgi:hypothetical protein
MALPTLVGNDGRSAVIAFTGTESIRRWNPQAWPVPFPAIVAAVTADFALEPGPPGTDLPLALRAPAPETVREIGARLQATGRFRQGIAVRA